ncbi:hypothetical protein SAMN00768000_3083 [Sulfobacillus thermosulfidooxidans DSM 9293]|uniref:TcpE family protein n=2 Tax=Sulfobacillus thermosulfidooxidans TaxID=28034 RepID=A0A1W1WKQ0_SULTA|nr:hypothetical protein [Sulfobacillus thermosulfidooxidans]PSR21714.1 MAG: hypothetical protein C7B47_17170 [Sulfobacillus thermosulfidooxidans]SMC06894.1 hypothetical protein SAMN00768000_3083 [Sulfobacillus thermosulfidooxidans DSM 9293]
MNRKEIDEVLSWLNAEQEATEKQWLHDRLGLRLWVMNRVLLVLIGFAWFWLWVFSALPPALIAHIVVPMPAAGWYGLIASATFWVVFPRRWPPLRRVVCSAGGWLKQLGLFWAAGPLGLSVPDRWRFAREAVRIEPYKPYCRPKPQRPRQQEAETLNTLYTRDNQGGPPHAR